MANNYLFFRRHRDITGIKSASIIENLSIRTLIVRKARQQFSSNLFAISPNQFREMDTVMKCLASPTMVLISICPFIWVFHELFELYYWCSLHIVLLISKCTSSVCRYKGTKARIFSKLMTAKRMSALYLLYSILYELN